MSTESRLGLFIGFVFIVLFAVVMFGPASSNQRNQPAMFGASESVKPNEPLAAGAQGDPSSNGAGRLNVTRNLPAPRTVGTQTPQPTPPAAQAEEDDTSLISDRMMVHAEPRETGLPVVPTSVERNAPHEQLADASRAAGHDDATRPPTGVDSPAASAAAAAAPGAFAANDPAAADSPPAATLAMGATKTPADILNEAAARRAAGNSPPRPGNETARPQPPVGGAAKDNVVTDAVGGKPADVAAHRSRGADNTPRDGGAAKTHRVKRGENLTMIAKQYYGSESPRMVNALFDANKHVLKDPNSVRSDVELVIPQLDRSRPAAAAGDASAATTPERKPGAPRIPNPVDHPDRSAAADRKSDEPTRSAGRSATSSDRPDSKNQEKAPARYRTYTVKKGETLASIAARVLGDARRHDELFEMNRDRLKSADRLITGTELRVPEAKKPAPTPKGSRDNRSTAKKPGAAR